MLSYHIVKFFLTALYCLQIDQYIIVKCQSEQKLKNTVKRITLRFLFHSYIFEGTVLKRVLNSTGLALSQILARDQLNTKEQSMCCYPTK